MLTTQKSYGLTVSVDLAQPSPPWPPRPCQFSARLFQLRLETRLVGMEGSMFVRRGFQFIEHDGHVARHADLIGPGVPEQRRF
jgi:hypothetical protein